MHVCCHSNHYSEDFVQKGSGRTTTASWRNVELSLFADDHPMVKEIEPERLHPNRFQAESGMLHGGSDLTLERLSAGNPDLANYPS